MASLPHISVARALGLVTRVALDAVAKAVERVGGVLAPFAPRPHWGKVTPAYWRAAASYERAAAFVELQRRLDPDGRFMTPWLAERLG